MNLLGPLQNRQEPAQMAKPAPLGSCIRSGACQSLNQASAQSPRFAVVRKSHYPSPSSPRFRTFWSEPGLFFAALLRGAWSGHARFGAGPRNRSRFPFANCDSLGIVVANKKTTRGCRKCKLQKSFWAPVRLSRWRDANGMILSARALVPPQGPSLRQPPMATCLQAQSSVRALVRFAMTSVWASATDHCTVTKTVNKNMWSALGVPRLNMPARGLPSGGFFVANALGAMPAATT